jgi:archaeal type IV pilus assembly protein PilA
MAFTKQNEEAVSPVIGVILMVAITVILAAVIAAFVFGMAGNISKTKVVAATAQRLDSNTIRVTYMGGQDSMGLEVISFTVNDTCTITNNLGTAGTTLGIGNSTKLQSATGSQCTNTPGKNHVVGVGQWTDGTKQVIVDQTL